MKKLISPFALFVLAIVHSLAFTYVWAFIGAKTMFTFGGLSGVVLGTLITSILVTPAFSLLAGFVCGSRYVVTFVAFIALAMTAFRFNAVGLSNFFHSPNVYLFLIDLAIISALAIGFYFFGTRIKSLRRVRA